MSVMLYKKPGKHKIHGDMLDYIIVDESEVESALTKGWHLTTPEAIDAYSNKSVKKNNLIEKATDLGIEFDGRTSPDKLEALVNEKIEENAKKETVRVF